MPHKKDILKIFANSQVKTALKSLFNKVAGPLSADLLKRDFVTSDSCEICVNFTNIFFTEHLRTSAYENLIR